MFFITKTISRQHLFPFVGKRPAIASNVTEERPASTVETLVRTSSGDSSISHVFKVDDGQQGWYRAVVASCMSPSAGPDYGWGRKIDYRFYVCPGSMIQYWRSSGSSGGLPDRASSNTSNITTSCFGASGAPYSSGTPGGSGAGAGYNGSSLAGYGGGGSGVVVSLLCNSEYRYNTNHNLKIKNMCGWSNYVSFVFDNSGESVAMIRTPSQDSGSKFAWVGSIEEGDVTTTLICLTDIPTVKQGDEVSIYRSDDLVVPYIVTNITSVNKTTYYIKYIPRTTNSTIMTAIYTQPIYDSNGTKVYNSGTSAGSDGGVYYVVVDSKKYYQDPDVTASYERMNFYGWEYTPPATEDYSAKGRIIWSNSSSATNLGTNGNFAYEKCGDNIVVSPNKYQSTYLTRRSDLDTIGSRVAFGSTTYYAIPEPGSSDVISSEFFINNTTMNTLVGDVSTTQSHYVVNGTGTYVMILCGGGGYDSGSSVRYGGSALGSELFFTNQQTAGYSYAASTGPSDVFGSNIGRNGAGCVVDMNDLFAYDTQSGSVFDDVDYIDFQKQQAGLIELYKITDSSEVTKYSQKIYFAASDRDYTAVLTLNGVATTVTIKKSLSVTEYFLLDVKQGDSLTIELIGDGGSTISNAYVISTETIAFGINPGSAPWKEREYTSPVSNVLLAFSPSYKYGAILVAGGGAGGDGGTLRHSARTPGVGGAGETSLIRTIKFTPNDSQIAKITVGSGGVVSSDPNSNGGTSANADYANVHGGDGGRPTFITFPKKVTINSSNYRPTYAYSVKNTTTNAVGYTIHTYPSTDGQLVSFYFKTSSRLEDGTDKGYFLNGHLVDTSTGETWEFCNESNQANQTFLNVKDIPLKAIFCEGTGGGGGGGGGGINSRNGTAGAGGAGGGYYRFNYENSTVQSVPGRGSSSPNGGAGYTGNTIERFIVANVDWTYLTACAGTGDSGRSGYGGTGGQGYGASGGAGGSGGNHSGAVCGSGGAGAGGSPWAGWGSYAANGMDSSWRRQYAEDISSQYQALGVYTYRPSFIGNAGKGGDGGSIGGKGTAGQNGYLYVYRFENVDETTDCGVLVDDITETIDCGELSETVTETTDCDLI